jgi:hypothetical protein
LREVHQVSRIVFTATIAVCALASRQAWADDSRASGAAAPKDAKAAEAAQAVSEPQQDGTVFLHVASPETVTVTRNDTGEVVCTSPCDKTVPGDVPYRITGSRPSPAFVLAASNGRANVKVKPGSNGEFWVGVGALGLSAGLIAGGVITLVHGVVTRAPVPGQDGVDTDNTYTNLMGLGAGLCILGTVAGLWGVATIVSNSSTKVRGNITAATAAQSTSGSSGATRAAAWARTQPIAASTPGPTFLVPILRGTF